MPAKMPRAREYVSTSAFIFQSVSAAASAPTGPAAAEASAPSLNLLASRCCIPWSLVTIITRSTAWPPSCSPQLPPVIVIGAGALHVPLSVRHVATPLPWLPPKPTAIFTMEGTTAMHFASFITLSGIALSGVAIISFKTLAALSSRLSISDWSLSSFDQARQPRMSKLAPKTSTYLGSVELIFVIGDLFRFHARSEQLFECSCAFKVTFGVLAHHRVRPVNGIDECGKNLGNTTAS